MGHLSPVPAHGLFSPALLRQFADRAREKFWTLPEPKRWPQTPDGRPIVETERDDRLYHTLRGGEGLERLKEMYKRSRSKLEELNPEINLSSLQAGDRVLVWERDPDEPSVSFGGSAKGRLINGEPMPEGENYEILFRHRTFGTYYMVSEVRRVFDEYYERFPDAHKLMVGDMSFRDGGSMHPHSSHRSGRDVDISYPRTNRPPNFNRFHHVRRDELDAEKTLFFVKSLIEGGYLKYVFMDHWFQGKLYKLAKKKGAPDEWLERVFEYPDWGGPAIIRHEPGHRNHMHIRFRCQPTDRLCEK